MTASNNNTPRIDLETQNGVTLMTLNDPPARNALSEQFGTELNKLLKTASQDPHVRAVVLTGAGKGFCSGAKLSAPVSGDSRQGPPDLGEPLNKVYNPLMRTIQGLDVPFIVAVNGAAAGMGSALALSGDIILASEEAFFLPAFSRIGLAPDGGATYLIAKSAGRVRAMEMALLDERIPAPQALEWGLINRVVSSEDLIPTAMGIATQLAAGPTKAYSHIRKLVWQAAEQPYHTMLDAEAKTQSELGLTEDHQIGVKAFMTREKPNFTGK